MKKNKENRKKIINIKNKNYRFNAASTKISSLDSTFDG